MSHNLNPFILILHKGDHMSKLSIKNSGPLYFCAKIFILDPLGEDPARPGPGLTRTHTPNKLIVGTPLFFGQNGFIISDGEPPC